MTEAYKQLLLAQLKEVDWERPNHVEEFGDCIGIVEGPVDYGSCKGPEVDVRWQPSNLRYGYHPDHLEIVE